MNRDAENFIINTLNIWNDKYKGIKIIYYYDNKTKFHIIEIGPESIMHNKRYKKDELILWSSFIKKFVGNYLLISKINKINNMYNILYKN